MADVEDADATVVANGVHENGIEELVFTQADVEDAVNIPKLLPLIAHY